MSPFFPCNLLRKVKLTILLTCGYRILMIQFRTQHLKPYFIVIKAQPPQLCTLTVITFLYLAWPYVDDQGESRQIWMWSEGIREHVVDLYYVKTRNPSEHLNARKFRFVLFYQIDHMVEPLYLAKSFSVFWNNKWIKCFLFTDLLIR